MPDEKPPLTAEVVWSGGLRFDASAGRATMVVDGDGEGGPSPMQALAVAVAGCMAADVVAILQKGRHPLSGLRLVTSATRAAEHPRRFTHLVLDFHITGDVPRDAIERAVTLSRTKYCSALLSLRDDINVDVRIHQQP